MKRITCLAAVVFLFLLTAWANAGQADKKLDVYWVDTEGGGATLFVTPAGESILIDSGNPGGRDAKRIFDAASKQAGLKQIDHYITTHFHIDHFGGAAELAAMLPIRNVYDNGEFPGGHERPSKEYLEFKAEKRSVLNPGDELPLKQPEGSPKVGLRVLAARKQFVAPPPHPGPVVEPGRKKPDDYSDNANSIASLITFGGWKMYVGGDITWNMEAKLVSPTNLVGKVDVYQVTHHGLDISNNEQLVKALEPTVAVFSNGPKKGAMPEVFATLKSVESIKGIYQIHKNLRPDGATANVPDEFIANKEESDKCEGNFIKLQVEPDGKKYTVTIPATKHETTFETLGR